MKHKSVCEEEEVNIFFFILIIIPVHLVPRWRNALDQPTA
jgi:hypothetical protein